MRHTSGFLIFSGLLMGGASNIMAVAPPHEHTTGDMYARLNHAMNSDPTAIEPLVTKVLMDSVQKRYKYDARTRALAFDALASVRLPRLLPLIRLTASMSYQAANSVHRTWDLVSIGRALDSLGTSHDEQATAIALGRLEQDPWVQASAVECLEELRYWKATEDIERLLIHTPADAEHFLSLDAMLSFLAKSSLSTREICERERELEQRYYDCPASMPSCVRFHEYVTLLREHLECAGAAGVIQE